MEQPKAVEKLNHLGCPHLLLCRPHLLLLCFAVFAAPAPFFFVLLTLFVSVLLAFSYCLLQVYLNPTHHQILLTESTTKQEETYTEDDEDDEISFDLSNIDDEDEEEQEDDNAFDVDNIDLCTSVTLSSITSSTYVVTGLLPTKLNLFMILCLDTFGLMGLTIKYRR